MSAVSTPDSIELACGSNRMHRLGEALQGMAVTCVQQSWEQWRFQPDDGKAAIDTALSDHWLVLSTPLRALPRELDVGAISSMLQRNGRMNDCARLVGCGLSRQRQVVIDIPAQAVPWEQPLELAALLAKAVTALQPTTGRSAVTATVAPAHIPAASFEKIQDLLGESTWAAQSTPEQGLEVVLDVPGYYMAAQLSREADTVHLRLPLLQCELADGGPTGRAAVLVLLWVVSGGLRLVKPVYRRSALDVEVVLWETCIDSASLAHACAALSLALQQFIPAAQLLLADEQLARIYLGNMGFPPTSQRFSRRRHSHDGCNSSQGAQL